MSSSFDPLVLSPAQLKGAVYQNQSTDLFRQSWLATLARHEADTDGKNGVSNSEKAAFLNQYDTDGKYGLSSVEAEAMIAAFEKKSNAKFGTKGSAADQNIAAYNARLAAYAKAELKQIAAPQVLAPLVIKPFDITAARTMMAQHYPGFELLNMSGESQINPQRVVFYWNDDAAKGGPYEAAHTSLDGVFDPVRQSKNRCRNGLSEMGDQAGYPLYIRVPNDTPPEKLEALLDDLRSLSAYAAAFPHGAHSRLASLRVHSHGASGAYLSDSDGWHPEQGLGHDGYDLLPEVKGKYSFYKTAAPMELDRHTQLLDVDACEILADLSAADITALKAQVARNGAAMRLNSTVSKANWGIDPKSGKRWSSQDFLNDPTGQTRIAALGENAGLGGNAFLVVPAGWELPGGTKALAPTIVRYAQKGDDASWRTAPDYEARTKAIFDAWQADGGLTIDAKNAPQQTLRYNETEEKNYQNVVKIFGQ
jgi:hypothetical protein